MSVKLSLICPVYKVSEYIPDLMNSLLKGVNSPAVEVIFIDDCCPNRSIDICEAFLDDNNEKILFKSVFLKLETNQGQAAARNKALKECKGNYIGFIDSDDAIASNYWSVLEPYIDISCNDIIEFSFEEFTNSIPNKRNKEICEFPSSILNVFKSGFFVWTRLYKKELVANLEFPYGMIYEDVFYNVHAFSKASNIVRLSTSLVYYRKRHGSTTALRTSEYSQLIINLITAIKETINQYENPTEIISLLQKRTLLSVLKGLKIQDKKDRKRYFQLCYPQILSIKTLPFQGKTTNNSKMAYYLACFICRVLK